jgi:hypothetical protein
MSKKLKTYRLFFQVLSPNRKFLALILHPQLQYLERALNIYLGSAKPGKIRPCIFWKVSRDSQEYYKLVFLTHSRKSPVSINLGFCHEKEKRCEKKFFFYPNSFVLETPDKEILAFKFKDKELLGEFINCGPCDNLEILDNLNTKEF